MSAAALLRTPARSAARARPGAGRARARRRRARTPRGRARAASRRRPARPASAAASTASRCAAVHVQTHTTSTASTSSASDAAGSPPWCARDAARRARDRSSYVAVERARRRAPRRRAAGARTRARCRCGRTRRARSGSSSRPHALVGVDERRRADRAAPEAVAHRVDRVLDRGAPLGARVVDSIVVVERRERAPLRRAAGASSCDSDTPSSRTPRATSNSGEQLAGGRRARRC